MNSTGEVGSEMRGVVAESQIQSVLLFFVMCRFIDQEVNMSIRHEGQTEDCEWFSYKSKYFSDRSKRDNAIDVLLYFYPSVFSLFITQITVHDYTDYCTRSVVISGAAHNYFYI